MILFKLNITANRTSLPEANIALISGLDSPALGTERRPPHAVVPHKDALARIWKSRRRR